MIVVYYVIRLLFLRYQANLKLKACVVSHTPAYLSSKAKGHPGHVSIYSSSAWSMPPEA